MCRDRLHIQRKQNMKGEDNQNESAATTARVETMRGYSEVPVKLQGSDTTQMWKVSKVPWTRTDEFLRCIGSVAREIALYTGRSLAEVERLSEDSAWAVHEEGRRLNPSYEKTLAAFKPLMDLYALPETKTPPA